MACSVAIADTILAVAALPDCTIANGQRFRPETPLGGDSRSEQAEKGPEDPLITTAGKCPNTPDELRHRLLINKSRAREDRRTVCRTSTTGHVGGLGCPFVVNFGPWSKGSRFPLPSRPRPRPSTPPSRTSTRMGEWSEECYACTWREGFYGPVVGATFDVHNRHGVHEWTR
jgi:hypothetical protein